MTMRMMRLCALGPVRVSCQMEMRAGKRKCECLLVRICGNVVK
jgi:hypothetical protein